MFQYAVDTCTFFAFFSLQNMILLDTDQMELHFWNTLANVQYIWRKFNENYLDWSKY